MQGQLILVTGGARSGKSRFAEQVAAASGRETWYVATMTPLDEELRRRVERHRARRPPDWVTVEEPFELIGAVRRAPSSATLLIDCLGLWVSNLLFSFGRHESWTPAEWERWVDHCVASATAVADVLRKRDGLAVVVTNEVGLGIVPGEPLTRWYRDALGLVNQAFAARATAVYLLVAGIEVKIR
jgi:adenosylcobinamide kinase/adenosylcobinamide-phosphate guanylyltransferase